MPSIDEDSTLDCLSLSQKKSFTHMMQMSKNMNFTTNEVAAGQLNESLLNMSTGEQVKPRSRHATSKLAKRKMESLIQH